MNYNKLKQIEIRKKNENFTISSAKNLKRVLNKLIKIIKLLIYEYYEENPNTLIEDFLKKTSFLQYSKERLPEEIRFLKFLSNELKLNFNEVFISQCFDELIWYKNERDSKLSNGCSSIASIDKNNSKTYIAQNVDHLNIFKDLGILIRNLDYSGNWTNITYSIAGIINLTGINSNGIAICTNGLALNLAHSLDGLPVSLVVNGLLNQSNINEAVDFLKNIKHASGQNYIIANEKQIKCFECSSNRIVEYKWLKNSSIVFHTNHPLVIDNLGFNDNNLITENEDSKKRFDFIENEIRNYNFMLDITKIKNILSSHHPPICSHKSNELDESNTIASVIYELSDNLRFLYNNGPPCQKNYMEIMLNKKNRNRIN